MKNKTTNGFLTILFGILIVVLAAVIWRNISLERDLSLERSLVTVDGKTPVPTPPPPENTSDPADDFIKDGDSSTSMRLAVAGDIVCHSGLNQEALQEDKSYDYAAIFGGAAGHLQKADYAVACIETTFPDTTDYSGYPMFKSPSDLAKSLATAGIDMLSTASNHCLDASEAGLIRTLDVLDENGIAHVGTYRSKDERDANNGIKVVEVNGISIAFLAFTYGTNGMSIEGKDYLANVFYKDYLTDLSEINYDMLKADMAAARELDTDVIAVWMHWGIEHYTKPVKVQYDLADFLFAEGADLILGGHTHVPQPMELRELVDNEGNKKTGFIVYSLGNFVSCQDGKYVNLTAILNITLEKNQTSGETRIKSVNYAPMFMVDLEDYFSSPQEWRYRLWDLNTAINNYDSGNDMGVINTNLYQAMKKGLEDIRGILGEDMDMYS